MPSGNPVDDSNVSAADLKSASKKIYLYRMDDPLGQPYGVDYTDKASWKVSSTVPFSTLGTAQRDNLQFSLDEEAYDTEAVTQFYSIEKLGVLGFGRYDYYFSTVVQVFYPLSGSTPSLVENCTMIPVYRLSDGTMSADSLHTYTVSHTYQYGEVNGEQWTACVFHFAQSNNVFISSDWIPEGAVLSGFVFRFEMWEMPDLPAGTVFSFSNIRCRGYYVDDGTTAAIERQTEQISDDIKDATDQIVSEVADATEKQTEEHRSMFERLGDRISGFFDNLLEGLKGFFIPEDGYFDEYFAQWDAWMSDHFGALYYPFEIVVDVLTRLFNLKVSDTPTITFPAIQVGDTVMLESQVYTFLGPDTPSALLTLYQTYRYVVTAIIAFWMVNLAWKKLSEILGGGT